MRKWVDDGKKLAHLVGMLCIQTGEAQRAASAHGKPPVKPTLSPLTTLPVPVSHTSGPPPQAVDVDEAF